MKGWILIAIVAGIIYYLATETNKLDKPIADADKLLTDVERKLDSMTGTQIIKADNKIKQIKAQIADRLSSHELDEFNRIFKSANDIEDFKSDFCSSANAKHNVFSRDNLAYICDSL